MIIGKVDSGCGCASKTKEEAFQHRCSVSGVKLQRGTLNVRVPDLNLVIKDLKECTFQTDVHNEKLGPLEWWTVKIINKQMPNIVYNGFIVRHQKTHTKYLEIMSRINFRSQGFNDGDEVEIEKIIEGDKNE